MSLLTVVRSGIEIANQQTKSLQSTVTLEHATILNDGFGTIEYGPPLPLRAIVDWKQKHLRTQGGELTVSRASVLFIDIAELVAATNGDGINDEDRITLADGTTGPIIDMAGFIDAETTHPMYTEVFLG